MTADVAVLLPTYQRPEHLYQALKSIAASTVLPKQVLIGDDSTTMSTATKDVALSLGSSMGALGVDVVFVHNVPRLGQAANVQNLLERSTCKWSLILHDDDALLPQGLRSLYSVGESNGELDVIYGLQVLINNDGSSRPQSECASLNSDYFRTTDRYGIQTNTQWSALVGQVPNNCFLMKTRLARDVGYSAAGKSDGVDYHFANLLASKGAAFFLVGDYVSAYRLSDESVSSGARNEVRYDALQTALEFGKLLLRDSFVRQRVRGLYLGAVRSAVRRGEVKNAVVWSFRALTDFRRP